MLKKFLLIMTLMVLSLVTAVPAQAEGCDAPKPGYAPSLTHAFWSGNSVTLYFVPVIQNNTGYFISYSTNDNAEQHGVGFSWMDSSGMIPYTVNGLDPHQTWYFKVRGEHNCMPGDWSQIIKVESAQKIAAASQSSSMSSANRSEASAKPAASPSPSASASASPSPSPEAETSEANEPGFFSRAGDKIKGFFNGLRE